MQVLRRLTVVGLCIVLMAPISSAQNIFDDSVGTCTGNNCSSLRIPGTLFAFGASAGQFVISVFAAPGECVRLDLISPPHPAPDMELVVIAPDGSVFRNDDRNGALDRRPLVKIAAAPQNGWYTVRVGQFAGAATETNIVLLYGRYANGNPNCAAPTIPLAPTFDAAEDSSKDNSSAIGAPASEPGAGVGR